MDAIERVKASWEAAPIEYARRDAAGDLTWKLDWTMLFYANIFYFAMLVILYYGFKGKPFDTTYAPDDKEKKKPIKGPVLSMIMKVYNLSCVLAASSSAYGMIGYLYFYGLKFGGNPQGTSDTAEGKAWIQWAVYMFYYQKFWEFIDTFIFLMRNSYRQVSFLHVYHHSSITIVVAMYAHFDTSGDVYLPVMLNSIVHVIMYGYYFCGAAGFKFQLALRPHITKMQLTQFLIIASQAFMVWSHGPDVGYPDFMKLIMIIYMGSMLYLFGKFFVASYMKPKPAAKKQ